MIKTNKDLCSGCGFCVKNCPSQAITLVNNKAVILQQKCTKCGICLSLCPKGAITDRIPASSESVIQLVNELEQTTEKIIHRIEKLKG